MSDFNSQRVERAIAAQLSQTFTGLRLTTMTGDIRKEARADMVGLLDALQRGGDIPDDVNVRATQAVTHPIDPTSIDVQIPVLLRLYIQDGSKSVRTARFQHDSDCCRFIGHGLGCDLYWCDQHGMVPTVIARYSSRPSDYQSGLLVARAQPVTEPLGLALSLAREAGFTDEGQVTQ